MTPPRRPVRFLAPLCAAAALLCAAGCGKTITREATEQLLTADSIDRAVARLDLTPFAGRSVFLDTELLEHKKLDGVGVGGQNYLIGSLRQHFMAAGARLETKATEAEYIVEARAGAVGSDSHEIVYGMPANSLLSSASSLVPNSPPLPALPELSIAKRSQEHAATKLRLFAYHRERREIVWQSGEAAADSQASHTWLFGAGPFEKGEIYGGARFAGEKVSVVPKWLRPRDPEAFDPGASLSDYNEPRVYGFEPPPPPDDGGPPELLPDGGARLASAEETAATKPAGKKPAEKKPAEKKPAGEPPPILKANGPGAKKK